jgi:hypothetical protein
MSHLLLGSDNPVDFGFSLYGDVSLTVTFFDESFGANKFGLNFLVLSGTTSATIRSQGFSGANFLGQLGAEDNDLTTVTIGGYKHFSLGTSSPNSNAADGVVTDMNALPATSPTTIQSSLTLIDASATTGGVEIFAGATNTTGAGDFANGQLQYANVAITYTGLTIKGGSGNDFIENDAKDGVVTDGNGTDVVILGGAGAAAILGTGTGDFVEVGASALGTNEVAGSTLGDKVTFGAAATAKLFVAAGAEAGLTAGTTSIGLTKVHDAVAGMEIYFGVITTISNWDDETTNVAAASNLTTAENEAVADLHGAGVAYFNYKGNEYFIATNNVEPAVSSGDAIVKLVGVVGLTATDASGLVTLH